MKEFTTLTNEELVALTQEEIDRYLALSLAEEGIVELPRTHSAGRHSLLFRPPHYLLRDR